MSVAIKVCEQFDVGDIISFDQLNEFVKKKKCNVFIEVAKGKFYVQIAKKFLLEQLTGTAEVTFSYNKALKVIWIRILDDNDPE